MYFKKGKAIKMLSCCGPEVLCGHVAEGDPAVPPPLAAHVQMWQKVHLAPEGFWSLQGHHCTWQGRWPWFTFPPLSSLAGNTRGSGWRRRHFSPFWAPGTLGQGVVFLLEARGPSVSLSEAAQGSQGLMLTTVSSRATQLHALCHLSYIQSPNLLSWNVSTLPLISHPEGKVWRPGRR